MKQMIYLSIALVFLLQGCNKLDDYMLGKDNTPTPAELKAVQNKAKISEKWSVAVGKSNKNSTFLKLKPVVRGDIIYTAAANGVVQAVDKKQGKLIWSQQLKEGIVSGPTVANGYVAVGTNRSRVILIRQSDGKVLHQLKVSSDALSRPTITSDKVIVKTIDGNLYAFDLKSGEKTWVAEHGAPSLILKASSSPVVMGQQVLVGFSDGKLDAVDIATGRVAWQRSIAYATGASDVERLVDIDADPLVRGNTVYLASYQGYVGALSLGTGEFIWNKPASVYKNLAIDGHTLYLTDSNDVLWAMDRQNGQVKWKQEALKARGLTEPVLMGKDLIVADKTGYVHVIATDNGELIGRERLDAAVDVAPVVDGNNIYVMTTNGKLNSLSIG